MKFNVEQELAINSTHPRILCLAGAGTGKTAVMIEKMLRMVDKGVDPATMLCLTFTNAAANEMLLRYKSKNKSTISPEFRTFHAFCYHLLNVDATIRQYLGYFNVPSICEEAEMKQLEKEASLITGLSFSAKKRSGLIKLSASEQFQLDTLIKMEDKLMKQRNLITFDKLCYDVAKLFEEDLDIIQKYKEKYKYIFVDEFQDTDPKQWKFVKSFSNSNLFLVGDALQNIYAFRGSDNSIIKAISEDSDWECIRLGMNYRSLENICRFANKNSSYAKGSYRVALKSAVGEGGDIIILNSQEFYEDGSITDNTILELIESSSKFEGSTAIISRTNALADFVRSYLISKGIPLNESTYQDAPNLIKSALDPEYAVTWLSSFLKSNKYSEFIRIKNLMNGITLEEFINMMKPEQSLISKYKVIQCVQKIVDSSDSDSIKLLDICNYFDIDTKILSDNDIDSIESFLAWLSEKHIESSCLHVGTIHSVKGLEYDNVIILGVGSKSFRLTSEENNNLYYVAITRAKKTLYVVKGGTT